MLSRTATSVPRESELRHERRVGTMHSTPGPHGGRPNRARRAVFISSTSVDLAEHRRVVIDTLLRLGLHPLAMEHMGSQPEGDATSVSYDYLAQADLYLGIVAWRYGCVPGRETRSVTHLEYEETKRRAEREPFPRLLFLADPSTEQDNVLFPHALRVAENQGKLRDFRAEVGREKVVSFFTTPDDLGRKVATTFSRYAFEQTVGTDERPTAPTWAKRQRFVALGLLEGTDWPRALVEWTIIGIIVAIVIGFSALLYQANVFHPFPAPPTPGPTATVTLHNSKSVTQDRPSCTPDNKVAPNSPWKSDGNNTTKYGCNSIGLIITQEPHAVYQSSVELPISGPGYQPDQDYSVSVQVSQFAPPHSCAGVLVRWRGYRAYGVELCQDGVWAIFKSFATNGNIEIQQIGRFTVKKSGSYQLDVEVSHDTLSAEVEDQGLPTVTLDPTFQDYAIGLFVDGTNPKPKDPSIDPNSNPGASAIFSNFVFTPLP
jgi:hypothetical protein